MTYDFVKIVVINLRKLSSSLALITGMIKLLNSEFMVDTLI
nr:hypothetical protein [Okeania sp. SIO2F4]